MLLDKIDIALLKNLQQDAKQTNKQLSLKLNLSVTAIYERIKKLERSGIIRKYVALVDRTKVDLGFTVFCHIKLVQHAHKSVVDFEREVVKLTEVLECFHVSGEYDYLLKVVVKDMDQFRNFMVEKLTTLQHIGSTQSSFTISEVKNTTALSF
ncbi:MAG: Lrp/AsnC family transcriptional regulator [Bacteroidia bacterium]|nr:Lrp/AsnC family transcriptional regulator [Bacteroidia bacterium]NNF31266.1 Lrp/AsnC family transcriptional regulator [Flavobacteriaceae bacterium]MBT8275892.1 Lrp/AsnC family transcriptional regulator [Bacteroidia bacterium]NNJ82951.1 Lrp/AsnC family transcriptional regulator [Flavobacteriaceae bacterium]NNK54539.1 Lrp/AsnC family transcriptional regulator [Flavobacteriaceae bacterium]